MPTFNENVIIGGTYKLGVGVANPLWRIHVADTSSPAIVLQNDTSNRRFMLVNNRFASFPTLPDGFSLMDVADPAVPRHRIVTEHVGRRAARRVTGQARAGMA